MAVHAQDPSDPTAAWRYEEQLPVDAERLGKAWQLLETYSHIPSDAVAAHVTKVRNAAYALFPYPCLGRWRFLDLYLAGRPEYPGLVARLRAGDRLLDVGCCFGQVVRQLVHDGVPATQVAGTDLRPAFVDLGYDLFQDRATLGAVQPPVFVTGDIFDEAPESPLTALDGRFDVLHAASFLHLFDWPDQVRAGVRMVRFLRPDAAAPLILGRQVGSSQPGAQTNVVGHGSVYRHNEASLQRLWDAIGAQTGTRWAVRATLTVRDEAEGKREMLQFVVKGVKEELP